MQCYRSTQVQLLEFHLNVITRIWFRNIQVIAITVFSMSTIFNVRENVS